MATTRTHSQMPINQSSQSRRETSLDLLQSPLNRLSIVSQPRFDTSQNRHKMCVFTKQEHKLCKAGTTSLLPQSPAISISICSTPQETVQILQFPVGNRNPRMKIEGLRREQMRESLGTCSLSWRNRNKLCSSAKQEPRTLQGWHRTTPACLKDRL